MKFHTILVTTFLLLSSLSLLANGNGLEEVQQERFAIALQSCAQKYEQIKKAGRNLSRFTRPFPFASTKTKELYQRRVLILRAYQENIRDFERHLLTANVIKAEPNFSKKVSLLREYLSNCSRFSEGILGFVDYAKTGRAPDRVTELVYLNFIEHARRDG